MRYIEVNSLPSERGVVIQAVAPLGSFILSERKTKSKNQYFFDSANNRYSFFEISEKEYKKIKKALMYENTKNNNT